MTRAYDKACLERAADTLGRMLDYSAYSLHYDIAAMMELFIACGAASSFERGDIRLIAGMSGTELAYEVLERSGIDYQRTQPRYTRGLSAEYWCGQTLARMQWASCRPFHQIMRSFSPAAFISAYGKSRLSFLDSLPLVMEAEKRSAELVSFGREFTEKAVSDLIGSYSGGKEAPGEDAVLTAVRCDDNAKVPGSAGTTLKEEAVSAGAVRSALREETPLKRMRIKNGLSQSGLAAASGVPLRTIQQYEQRQKDLRKARAEYLIALSRALHCDPAQLLHD